MGDLLRRQGVAVGAGSAPETGRRAPSFENLRGLADALDVSTDYLLGRQDAVGAAGPGAEQLFRNLSKHISRMSASDQEKLAEIAKILAAKDKAKDEK